MSKSTSGKRVSNVKCFLRAGLLAAALVASGCAVGPDYHRPTPWMPGKYINPSAAATPETSATTEARTEVVQWWRTFNDPTLNALVTRAVSQNLDLKQATARLRQARAARGVASAPLFPNINSNDSYTHSGSGSRQSVSSDLYSAGVDATWELDVFGGVRRNVESADATVRASVWDRRGVLISVVSEVAIDYINLRSFQRRIAISISNLESDRRSVSLTRQRHGAGFVPELDVANAEAQAATTESGIPSLETASQQTIYSLSILLGREPATLVNELSTEEPIPLTPPVIPIGLPSELLRRRPDIRIAEEQLHSATAQIGVATADLFPKFSLNGDISLQAGKFKPLGNWSSSVWSFGPTIDWPIFAGGSILANIEVQNAVQQQAILTYKQSILTALQDVENALIAYSNEQARRTALAEAVVANRKALDLSTDLYRQGLTEFLNVLNAERSLLGVEDALAQSEAAVAIDLATLYKALGGGWEINPLVPEMIRATTPPATAPPTLTRQLLYAPTTEPSRDTAEMPRPLHGPQKK
jgi:multidrug efflux system outer membrane protein